jgi:hypothetical protein
MPTAVIVTTVAGQAGVPGSADGTGSVARFNGNNGISETGPWGNMYVADTGNHTIRRITPAGVVTTLAGLAGVPGSLDGTGAAARFNSPQGLCTDSLGNHFIADSGNNTIRKITPAGVVTTLAGLAGASGSADGTGNLARFNSPVDVGVDGFDNVYVADTQNDTIRKVTQAGVVTTLAGLALNQGSADGTGAAARFNRPYGIGVSPAGLIFVPDTENHTIRQVTPAGVVTTLAGLPTVSGSADGTGAAARFFEPTDVVPNGAGNLFVVDQTNQTIRKIAPGNIVTTIAGAVGITGSTDGPGLAARFSTPATIGIDAAGNLYVADYGNDTVRKLTMFSTDAASLAALGGRYASNLTGKMLDWVLIYLLCKFANTP